MKAEQTHAVSTSGATTPPNGMQAPGAGQPRIDEDELLRAADSGVQYLTLSLGDELFCLEIDRVREVLEYMPVTRVPRVANYMQGIINVRGRAVPVMDLRTRFGMRQAERTVDTCIIIVEIDFDGEPSIVGTVADSVHEVLDIGQDDMEEAPRLGASIDNRFIRGIGKRDDTFVVVLDIDAIFADLTEGEVRD